MRVKTPRFTIAVFVIAVTHACSGDDDRWFGPYDGGRAIGDGAPAVCTASSSYGGVDGGSGSGAQRSSEQGSGSDYSIYWLGRMDPTVRPDFLQLTLYAGYGAYSAGPITPGTVNITGNELSYQTCGACIFLFTDVNQIGSDVEITDYYMPTSGTLTLTSVTDTIEGTITNLQLQHMVISGQDLVPANDGCTSSIASATIRADIEPPMGSGSAWGKPAPDGNPEIRFKLGNRSFQ